MPDFQSSEDQNQYLFVYGTLMQGLANHDVLASQGKVDFVSHGTVTGELYNLGDYPGLCLGDSETNPIVHGELYLLDDVDTVLEMLDIIEGVSDVRPEQSLYRREEMNVTIESETIGAWVYIYNHPVAKGMRSAHGDYRRFLAER